MNAVNIRIWAVVSVLVLTSLAALFVVRAGARTDVREIAIVGRDMAFYLDGNPTANPTLTLAAGERVRFVVRNETAGVVHDLTVDGLDLGIGPLETGQAAAVEFRAPDRPGRYEYYCRPHAIMMRGVLAVVGE